MTTANVLLGLTIFGFDALRMMLHIFDTINNFGGLGGGL